MSDVMHATATEILRQKRTTIAKEADDASDLTSPSPSRPKDIISILRETFLEVGHRFVTEICHIFSSCKREGKR
jgi:hypothetical protein